MKISKKHIPKWQFDELKSCGIDYTSVEEVSSYDTMRAKFRDYEQETEIISEWLGIGPESIVIDMGCGTGSFALNAAKKCKKVYAVDISETMLNYCREQAEKRNLSNIVYSRAGLLTYEHKGRPADAMVCSGVFHHLPDFWKQKALIRCSSMIRQGGRLYFFDIVLPSDEDNLFGKIDEWISTIESTTNDTRMAREAEVHIREDFTTYDWIMEGLIERSGFSIDIREYWDGFRALYVCTKL